MSIAPMNQPASPGNLRVALHLVLGLICLTLLPIAWAARPVWELDALTWLILGVFAAGYALALIHIQSQFKRNPQTAMLQVALAVLAMLVPAIIAAILWHPHFSRFALLTTPALAVALAWILFFDWSRSRLQTAAIGSIATAAVLTQLALGLGLLGPTQAKPNATVLSVNSSLYELEITSYQHWIPRPQTNQGAITLFGDRYLLVTGDGDLYVFAPAGDGKRLDITHLALRAPINSADFAQAIAGTSVAPAWFRVADVFSRPTPLGVQVLISHHYWNAQERCFVLRISSLEGAQADFIQRPESLHWKTLFESKPCVPLATGNQPALFYGIENGGRMALLDQDHLLMSIGDHGLNGWDSAIEGVTPQDPGKSFGKIVEIDLRTLSAGIFSLGHRNPQGLIVSGTGAIWSTEHGPQGGDELNLIQRGHNYGWPLATYGVEYGAHAWPLARADGQHGDLDEPYFSWIPSIGVSSLIAVSSPQFPRWQGDLLVGSLVGQTLWRLRLRDDRVVLAEQIYIGDRIRDVLEGHNGEIILWTDRETIMFLRPANADQTSGQSMFTICAACHVPAYAQTKSIGPSLKHIVGREVASLAGFPYSTALKTFGGRWTKQRLENFLADPQAVVPGTSMHFPGISDSASRQQLIDYLADPRFKLDQPPAARAI